jgi:hypothetical protein
MTSIISRLLDWLIIAAVVLSVTAFLMTLIRLL